MPNFVAEINMDIGYFKNKKIKKKKNCLKMVSRLKVGQRGEFMGSPCAYGAPRAHVEVLLVLRFPPTLVSCYSAVKMYLTLFLGTCICG